MCVRACLRVLGGVHGGVGDGRGFLLQEGPDGQSVVTGWVSGTAGISVDAKSTPSYCSGICILGHFIRTIASLSTFIYWE